MSRHDLQPKADQPHVVRATVGWDRPLQTFFAQVFFRTEDEPEEGEVSLFNRDNVILRLAYTDTVGPW